MSNARIESLKDHMPEVLRPQDVVSNWDEHIDVIPIDDPEEVGDKIFSSHSVAMQDGVLTSSALEIEIAGMLDSDEISPEMPEILTNIFPGNYAGSPTPIKDRTKSPPPDCLAFYLPFHYYYPDWWGVYLLFDGVAWLAREIKMLSGGSIAGVSAVQAARLFLYHHEAFHHKTECFATRLEITHRQPHYTTGFELHYSITAGTDDCLEEALANADAYKKVLAKFHHTLDLGIAFKAYILSSPPGYSKGVDVADRLIQTKNVFAEENQRICNPALPYKNPDLWDAGTYMFNGFSNMSGCVNYILPRGSRLASRLRFKPLLPPNKLVKKLRDMVGLEFVRHGGNHDIYRSSAGKKTKIPRHPKDITTGTLHKILRELEIPGGLAEFQRS